MGTGSFPGVRCGWGVTLTPHPLLVQRSKIEKSYRAIVACDRVKPTYLPETNHVVPVMKLFCIYSLCYM